MTNKELTDKKIEDKTQIQLTKGYVAKVDPEDFDIINKYKWQALVSRGEVRARRNICKGGKMFGILMHRQILNAPEEKKVDHINGDTLDNRKSNLRLCTQGENQMNSQGKRASRTGFKCVYQCPNGKYYVKIGKERKCIYGGTHSTLEEALANYNALVKEHHGAFAVLHTLTQQSKETASLQSNKEIE